jgi:hypothetical protein
MDNSHAMKADPLLRPTVRAGFCTPPIFIQHIGDPLECAGQP